MIEFRLRDHLKNDETIQTIVDKRVHPVRIPRMSLAPDTGAKLTYRRVTAGRTHYIADGATGHPQPKFQLIAWSQSYDEAKTLAKAVRNCMDGFGPVDFGDVRVHSVTNIAEEDEFMEPEDGSDEGWYAVALDYLIRYDEGVPRYI